MFFSRVGEVFFVSERLKGAMFLRKIVWGFRVSSTILQGQLGCVLHL